jgi:hypothetical protein
MKKTINIIIGGKLGDFLITLQGVKGLCKSRNVKANIFLIDIGWEFGFEKTYKDLYPILKSQSYIEDFQMLTDYSLNPIQNFSENSPIQVYNSKLIEEGYIVDDYLNAPLLYKACWAEIYADLFEYEPIHSGKWLTYSKTDPIYANTVVIHRKFSPGRFSTEFPYDQIISEYDSVVFASTNVNDYNKFPWKDQVPFIQVENLDKWFTLINSCAMYVGNLTAPVVIAQALDKLRIVELASNLDVFHWMGEERYTSKAKWFLDNHTNNLI